ncbi:uncharacterized protein LOC109862196 [Pseudomyrmex gracilis]|uniref:uncharacterized protein LOC109862196 n=1 Tax=Pseudomyrmex gracilis TaxID=219809 RepID=UPI000995810C|nr:uncharacterized protein LOC109862196 [Pseudomyrmex gracilis]
MRFRAGVWGGEDVRVVSLRHSPSRGGTALVRCSVEAAAKAVKKAKLPVGWCYRCFQPGHCRAQCSSLVDRSDLCYRCGRPGHKAAGCSEEKKGYSLCEEKGWESFHRMGGAWCPAVGRGAAMPMVNPP